MSKANQLTKKLLDLDAPADWKDFLFNLQTTLIEYGYFENLTELGRNDFAAKVAGLHHFFSELEYQ